MSKPIAVRTGVAVRNVLRKGERMNKMVGRLSRGSLIVLVGFCGLCGPETAVLAQSSHRQPPRGPVLARDHAVADEEGPFNALGATLFWGAWGYKFDRSRLERNLAVLSEAGVDYVRVLGSVGGGTWADQQTDPAVGRLRCGYRGADRPRLRPVRHARPMDAVWRRAIHPAGIGARRAGRQVWQAWPWTGAEDLRLRDRERSAPQWI